MADFIQGMSELLKQLESLEGIKTNTALLAGAEKLQGFAQDNAPVKTGYLRSSATSQITGDDSAELRFDANYSYYQEAGTSKMAGKHYVGRAISEHETEIVETVKNQMDKEVANKL